MHRAGQQQRKETINKSSNTSNNNAERSDNYQVTKHCGEQTTRNMIINTIITIGSRQLKKVSTSNFI